MVTSGANSLTEQTQHLGGTADEVGHGSGLPTTAVDRQLDRQRREVGTPFDRNHHWSNRTERRKTLAKRPILRSGRSEVEGEHDGRDRTERVVELRCRAEEESDLELMAYPTGGAIRRNRHSNTIDRAGQ